MGSAMRLLVDDVVCDLQAVTTLYQRDPFPGGRRFCFEADRKADDELDALVVGLAREPGTSRLVLSEPRRSRPILNELRYFYLPPPNQELRYFLNRLEFVELSADKLRVWGIASDII